MYLSHITNQYKIKYYKQYLVKQKYDKLHYY